MHSQRKIALDSSKIKQYFDVIILLYFPPSYTKIALTDRDLCATVVSMSERRIGEVSLETKYPQYRISMSVVDRLRAEGVKMLEVRFDDETRVVKFFPVDDKKE